MKGHKGIEEVLIEKSKLKERVVELAKDITKDYINKQPLVMICVLKGAIVFFADLIREIELDVQIDFVALSSYGGNTVSSGNVRMNKDVGCDLTGRDVIVVEDIIDTGVSMDILMERLKNKGTRSVKLCALLSKPSRRRTEIKIDYLGFEIPDEFVVGYGLDYDEKYRNLDYIGIYKA